MGMSIDQELAEISDLALKIQSNYLAIIKAEKIAMLKELQLEINKAEMHRYDDQIDIVFNQGLHKGGQLIQLKINELEEQEDGTNEKISDSTYVKDKGILLW